jgi:hypothetical protein
MTAAQSQNEILVSLAARNNAVPYDMLMTALGIPNERDFEDFIIQAIYQEVIQVLPLQSFANMYISRNHFQLAVSP